MSGSPYQIIGVIDKGKVISGEKLPLRTRKCHEGLFPGKEKKWRFYKNVGIIQSSNTGEELTKNDLLMIKNHLIEKFGIKKDLKYVL